MCCRRRLCFCREPVDRATFLRNLWWCFDKLEEKATDDSGKPAYFRFLTLLGGCWEWVRAWVVAYWLCNCNA